MSVLLSRVEAAQAVYDEWRGRPFSWGDADCAHLAAAALTAMGHADPLATAPNYRRPRSAKRALKAAGFADLEQALDALGFERVAPAGALPCDLLVFPGEGGWNALGVAIGQGRLIGFANGVCSWAPVSIATQAWRVDCRKPQPS